MFNVQCQVLNVGFPGEDRDWFLSESATDDVVLCQPAQLRGLANILSSTPNTTGLLNTLVHPKLSSVHVVNNTSIIKIILYMWGVQEKLATCGKPSP